MLRLSFNHPRIGLLFVASLIPLLTFTRLGAVDLDEALHMMRTGDYDGCAAMAAEAIEQRTYSEAWRNLKIEAELAAGRYEAALATWEEARSRFPSSVRLLWLGQQVLRFNGESQRADQLLQEIDRLVRQSSWRYSDPASRVVLGRYYLGRRMDAREVLEATFDVVKRQMPSYVDAYLGAAELALEKHDYALAASELEQAAKIDPRNADVFCGLARAYAPSDAVKADHYLQQALAVNPRHMDSLLLVVEAHVDRERYDEAEQVLQQALHVNPCEPRVWAYLAVLAHLQNRSTDERVCCRMALARWADNPEVEHLIGKKLSQKYRFAEGAAYQRRALGRDPDYLPARIQLTQDLLRLGQDDEGWQLADEVSRDDPYDVVAHNLVELQRRVGQYRVLEADGFVVRMEPREASLYGGRVIDLLRRARDVLCPRYGVTIDETIHVEIFPKQQDFAIRTFGLPGGDGFLGVCFGVVITANSPASQRERPTNWESVLWHEFCHVVTLHKTRHRLPRWLSEGISVYEEWKADPSWGERLTPVYREMLLGDDLVPISQLSGAFLQPPSPIHLQFAYYESALAVQYICEQYGHDALLDVLNDLAEGETINAALARRVAPLDQLDREFAEYARKTARSLAPDLDWDRPDLPPDAPLETWMIWLKDHPTNVWALRQCGRMLADQQRWAEAVEPLETLIKHYPEYVDSGGPYDLLAQCYRQLDRQDQETRVLAEWAKRSSAAVPAFLRLMELAAEGEDWSAVTSWSEKVLAVNPLLEAPHRLLAKAAEATGEHEQVCRALEALLELGDPDIAGLRYRLAIHLGKLGKTNEARRQLLMALEEAPRFRAAYRAFLELPREVGPAGNSEEELPDGQDANEDAELKDDTEREEAVR